VGPRADLNAVETRKNSCPCRESNPARLPRSLVIIMTERSRLHVDIKHNENRERISWSLDGIADLEGLKWEVGLWPLRGQRPRRHERAESDGRKDRVSAVRLSAPMGRALWLQSGENVHRTNKRAPDVAPRLFRSIQRLKQMRLVKTSGLRHLEAIFRQ